MKNKNEEYWNSIIYNPLCSYRRNGITCSDNFCYKCPTDKAYERWKYCIPCEKDSYEAFIESVWEYYDFWNNPESE